jgi:putative ABC transport system substrate-binding protein
VADDIAGKQLELLREVVPQLSRVAVLWNPPQPAHTLALKALERLGRAGGRDASHKGTKPADLPVEP